MTKALILGRANTVWGDIAAAKLGFHPTYTPIRYDIVVAVNQIACDYEEITDWASFHAEAFPSWTQKRRAAGFHSDYQLWTSRNGRRVTDFERRMNIQVVDCNGGSSGMVAVLVALEKGATKIVLAGIPLDNEAGHYDEKGPWDEAEMHRKAWEKLPLETARLIRSLSGWTRRTFGAPTAEWFAA